MTVRRGIGLPGNRKLPDGRPACCWCGGPLGPGRRRWCGQACVDEYSAQASQAGARAACSNRDRGVCAICGLDCRRLRRVMDRLWGMATRQIEIEVSGPLLPWQAGWGDRLTVLIDHPAAPRRRAQLEIAEALLFLWAGRSAIGHGAWFWEADHTIPLIEGGSLDLTNLRTLCLRCHRQVTRELAARRALARRRQIALPL